MSYHPSHDRRFSFGASSYDYICDKCANTDTIGGYGELEKPCPAIASEEEPQSDNQSLIPIHEQIVTLIDQIRNLDNDPMYIQQQSIVLGRLIADLDDNAGCTGDLSTRFLTLIEKIGVSSRVTFEGNLRGPA